MITLYGFRVKPILNEALTEYTILVSSVNEGDYMLINSKDNITNKDYEYHRLNCSYLELYVNDWHTWAMQYSNSIRIVHLNINWQYMQLPNTSEEYRPMSHQSIIHFIPTNQLVATHWLHLQVYMIIEGNPNHMTIASYVSITQDQCNQEHITSLWKFSSVGHRHDDHIINYFSVDGPNVFVYSLYDHMIIISKIPPFCDVIVKYELVNRINTMKSLDGCKERYAKVSIWGILRLLDNFQWSILLMYTYFGGYMPARTIVSSLCVVSKHYKLWYLQ